MVHLIKDIVDIYGFCKIWHQTAQEHLLCKLPLVSLTQVQKFLHFSFKTVENFSNSKLLLPRKDSWAKTRPLGSESMRILGGRLGEDGQAWNWLMYKTWILQVLSKYMDVVGEKWTKASAFSFEINTTLWPLCMFALPH